MASLDYLYTTCIQIKDSTAVPPGLLQPLPATEFRFSLWSIDFTINLLLSHGFNTITTCVDYLKKYTILIPCEMGDEILISAATALFFTKFVSYIEYTNQL